MTKLRILTVLALTSTGCLLSFPDKCTQNSDCHVGVATCDLATGQCEPIAGTAASSTAATSSSSATSGSAVSTGGSGTHSSIASTSTTGGSVNSSTSGGTSGTTAASGTTSGSTHGSSATSGSTGARSTSTTSTTSTTASTATGSTSTSGAGTASISTSSSGGSAGPSTTATVTSTTTAGSTSGTSTGGAICATCQLDTQCVSGFCNIPRGASNGFCDSSEQCTTDTQCTPYTCNQVSGSCACPASSSNGSSSTGSISSSSASSGSSGSISCSADSDCDPPQTICSGSACVAGCVPGQCASSTYCDIAGGHCEPETGATALGATCTNFWDCASGYCFSYKSYNGVMLSQCASTCAKSADCPASFACIDYGGGGVCLQAAEIYVNPDGGPALTIGTDVVGQTCNQPSTNPPTSTPCDSIFLCSNPGETGVCIDSCGTDNDCQTSQNSGQGWVCDAQTLQNGETIDACSPPLGQYSCETNSDCSFLGSGAQCDEFDTGLCIVNPVGSSCNGDGKCDHGACIDGKCSEPCCSWYDCPTGWTCAPAMDSLGDVFKVCQPAIADAGTLLAAAACDTANANACATNLCLPNDPTVPGHAGYCSTTCCRNSDCPTGMTCELEDNGFPYPDGGFSGSMGFCILR